MSNLAPATPASPNEVFLRTMSPRTGPTYEAQLAPAPPVTGQRWPNGTGGTGKTGDLGLPGLQGIPGIGANGLLSPFSLTDRAITGTDTAMLDQMHVCSGTSSDYTVTLPAVAGNAGRLIGLRMVSTLTKLVTIAGSGAELIDGINTRVMWANESAILYCDGISWTKIGGKTIPMAAAIQRNAAQTFAINTATVIAFDASLSIFAPAAMQQISNNRLAILRSGRYIYSASTYMNPQATVCSQYIWISGTLPRDCQSRPANVSGILKCLGYGNFTKGDFVTLTAYYDGGTTSIPGNTSRSAIETQLSLIESPTW